METCATAGTRPKRSPATAQPTVFSDAGVRLGRCRRPYADLSPARVEAFGKRIGFRLKSLAPSMRTFFRSES